MAVDVPELLELSSAELDTLFRQSPPGEIPSGEAEGTVLIAPGTQLAGPAAKIVHFLAWQGKVFDPERGELRNEIGPLGAHLVRAKVYKGPSWFDGNESIVLDYADTSLVAHWIRDEIRQIGPGTYLGIVYWQQSKTIDFALEFPVP